MDINKLRFELLVLIGGMEEEQASLLKATRFPKR